MTPDINGAWNFNDPEATEATFREMLRENEQASNVWQAELQTQIARAQGLQRRFDDAQATLDQLQPQLPDLPPVVTVRYELERGRALNSSGSPADALPHFDTAWNVARGAGLDGYAVDAAHMIAIATPAPADQLDWNKRALELAESSPDPDARRLRGSLLNNIGWTQHGADEYEAALSSFERALEARRESGNPQTVHVARWCVARCLRSLDHIDESLAILRELEQDDPETVGPLGYVHEEIGECLLAQGHGADAAPYFRRAHDLLSADTWLAKQEPERLKRLARLATAPGAS